MQRARNTALIILINSILSIPYLVLYYMGDRNAYIMAALFSDYIPPGSTYPWPLGIFASMFFDPTILDYFFNMLTLFFIGPFFENRYGSRTLWYVYLVSGIAAALSIFIYGPGVAMAGASGALFGLIGFIVALPDRWVILSNPWNIFAIIFLLTPIAAAFNIAYLGHLFGFIVGIIYGLIWYRRMRVRAMYRYRYFTGPY